MTLAKRVKELREAKNLSQGDLAKMVGVERSSIGHIETGRIQMPSKDILRAIAEALDTSPVELLVAAGYINRSDLPVNLADPTLDLYLRHQKELDESDKEIIRTIIRSRSKKRHDGQQ